MRREKLNQKLEEVIANPNIEITQDATGTQLKLKSAVRWQDENGKELTKDQVKLMLNSKDYLPELNTHKNIMVLKKI